MTPDKPVLRGTAQNPDAFFQGREAANPFYAACPGHRAKGHGRIRGNSPGANINLFDYVGAPDAERVIVLMGSGCEAAHETVEHLNRQGEKVGVLKVRLYRPFDGKRFVEALPRVGANRSPCWTAPRNRARPANRCIRTASRRLLEGMANGWAQSEMRCRKVVGGRYGLSSKEFTPAMVKAVFDNLAAAAAEESFHRRHQRRRFPHQPAGGSRIFRPNRTTSIRALVLRPRRGRHGRREQKFHQDHRRGNGQLRAGLFRL